jgi:AraC family ethanolamine operon transcriptional activator
MPAHAANPPVAATVVRPFHGIEGLNEAVKGGHLDHVQMGRGIMTGMLGHTLLGRGLLGFGRTTLPAWSRGCYNPTGYGLGILTEMSTPGRYWGEEAIEGSLLVCPPGTEADSLSPGPHGYVYLILPKEVFEESVLALAPESSERLLRSRGLYHPSRTPSRSLSKRTARLMRLLSRGQSLSPEASASASEDLLAQFVRAVSFAERSPEPSGKFFRHRRIVFQAEEYLRERLDQDVYTRDVCRHCAVSERTLHYAFREILGMTPMEYLRRRRLAAVRCELSAVEPEPGIVTRVATRWGFWHLGEFSAAYKALYGESPIETVRIRSGRDVTVA